MIYQYSTLQLHFDLHKTLYVAILESGGTGVSSFDDHLRESGSFFGLGIVNQEDLDIDEIESTLQVRHKLLENLNLGEGDGSVEGCGCAELRNSFLKRYIVSSSKKRPEGE